MAFHRARALQEAERSVAQGKIGQAIKQYLEVLENDPSDVSLLNTVGDLYIRDRNIPEGLRQFRRLAEAYVSEGFNVKAIAIFRKICKIDASSVETILRLAEVYQLQGLTREARDQFLLAVELFKKRNRTDQLLEVFRKLVQLDPDNIAFRSRLAAECEQSGKHQDAARAYLETGEMLLRREDQSGAEVALRKAAEQDPKNTTIQLLRARMALAKGQTEQAESIITASRELQSDPAGKRILLDAYLAARKVAEADSLAVEVFHSNPADFTPVANTAALMLEKGDIDAAYKLLATVSEPMIGDQNVGPLLEVLRQLWSRAPEHIPTLELIHRICERTADEATLPEVLEALGHAHQNAGDFEKAETVYLKLAEREPENEHYRGLLNAVQQRLGKKSERPDFSGREMALTLDDQEKTLEPKLTDAEQARVVQEALENSDLFCRYHLVEKALAELEKVLQDYPDSIEVHRRILEISHNGFPERGAAAAAQLARIYLARGDAETARKYQNLAAAGGAILPPPPPIAKVAEPSLPVPAPAAKSELVATPELQQKDTTPHEPAIPPTAVPAPGVPFDLRPPQPVTEETPEPVLPPMPAEPPSELDLSGDLEAIAASAAEAPAPSAPEAVAPAPPEAPAPPVLLPAEPDSEAPSVNEPAMATAAPTAQTGEEPSKPEEPTPAEIEDSRVEIEFYLDNGFVDEAWRTMTVLEEKYPENPAVAELRHAIEHRTTEVPVAEPILEEEVVLPDDEAVTNESLPILPDEMALPEEPVEIVPDEPKVTDLPEQVVQAESEIISAPSPAPPEEGATEEWELPTTYAEAPPFEQVEEVVVTPPPVEYEPLAEAEPPHVEPVPSAERELVLDETVAASGPTETADDLAGSLASPLAGLTVPGGDLDVNPAPPAAMVTPPAVETDHVAAQLSGLLAEIDEPGAAGAAQDERETHYNLGVAFREMGLLDESVGEFQKVVKGAGKGYYPPNFLQACSLLAICFMEKKMPAIAVRWYKRALESPGLDEEAILALQYDLGRAYELAGDARRALESFTEVYSQNIDFRDVADKIRELQQKA